MSGIKLTQVAETTIPTPETGKDTIFVDLATGQPSYKDDTGSVTSLQGTPGQGVPIGGTAGQALTKINSTDYNTQWSTVALDRSTVTSITSSSGVVTLDYALGNYFTITLSENITSWVISNPPGSGRGFSIMVQITQGAGPYTVADPGTAPGGSITVSTGSGDVDVLAITSFDNGTTLRCNLANDYT